MLVLAGSELLGQFVNTLTADYKILVTIGIIYGNKLQGRDLGDQKFFLYFLLRF